ncbi:hypothetical protein [Mucilaginibacter segetis]|uniref:Uncharacterized protein n=1 Tax=Mucilaginibacter segetis TaxID=2793071 RepID=A0A934PUE5_9SPHI|nr:hypothetical protein [Mucilaginibacter segetis]MBK0379727.1 hypothetical protein [Mucilaginibacter segetis]
MKPLVKLVFRLTLTILTFFPFKIFASPQMPDYIIYKNDTIATYNLLVEQYLQKRDQTNREQLFGLTFRDGASFNCWRGYQAIYKIQNDSLFLSDIINCGSIKSKTFDKSASVKKMYAIFGDKMVGDKVFIDWFSGELSFPLTNKLLRWDGVFYRIYEAETVLSFYNGKLLKAENVCNYANVSKGIDRHYSIKISDILFKYIKKIKFKNTDDCDCSEKYLITIDKEGKISNVKSVKYKSVDEISDSDEKNEYTYCTNTIRKALSALKFDIIKDKGKPISEDVYLEIWVEDNGKVENWTN